MTTPPLTLEDRALIRQKPLRYWIQCALEQYFEEVEPDFVSNVYPFVQKEMDYALLVTVLKYARGNQSTAAKWLGLARGTVRKKLQEVGLED